MISVIIPLYNKEPIIERSLRSVLSQDYDDFEVIVVNDGSTDRSAEIVKSIQDPRVVYVEQENGGPSKARNTGVEYSKGEWIVFLDADDELLPGALQIFSDNFLLYQDTDFFVCPYFINNGQCKKLHIPYKDGYVNNPFKNYFYEMFFPRTGAFIIKKHFLVQNPFNETLRRFEDLDFLFKIYKGTIIRTCSKPSMVLNQSYASASYGRKDISEDFVGHLSFSGKSFWEKMCLYKLYLEERLRYQGQIEKLYPLLKYRYDLLLLTKIFRWLHS